MITEGIYSADTVCLLLSFPSVDLNIPDHSQILDDLGGDEDSASGNSVLDRENRLGCAVYRADIPIASMSFFVMVDLFGSYFPSLSPSSCHSYSTSCGMPSCVKNSGLSSFDPTPRR